MIENLLYDIAERISENKRYRKQKHCSHYAIMGEEHCYDDYTENDGITYRVYVCHCKECGMLFHTYIALDKKEN